ncbi:WD40-repeat-containing domain protein [Phyllosticta citriasiana]|uniref:WD40-repeat-containing domain protein n=1 Tax=Phyllosticta citriasiana TaxID=595635 RepID=UPI0030FD9FA3
MSDQSDVSQTVQTQVLDPYTALGQLSYGPATQTTVVTTTTTTTTSFPPLVLNAPRHLHQRDPKQYPLAASPTPQSIKDFSFNIAGREARFREADDAEQTFNEYKKQQAGLRVSSGTITKSADATSHLEAPRRCPKFKAPSDTTVPPTKNPKKRSASPISIAEAAERASHQRKRPRPSINTLAAGSAYPPSLTRSSSFQASRYLDTTAPATPDTDAGSTGQTKIQKVRKASKRPSSRAGVPGVQGEKRLSNLKHISEEGIAQDDGEGEIQSTEPQETGNVTSARRSTASGGSQFSAMGIDNQISGVSATPPIAETDLEPILPVEDENETRPRIAHPNSLQSIANQDASLPSPSLSPITAAANLAQHAALPGLMGVEEEDDENDVSSLDIEREKDEEGVSRRSRDLIPAHRASEGAGSVTKLSADSQPPAPTFRDIPVMVDAFDAMPDDLKTYIMYQFLRRCAKSTLHFVANVVNPALKIDFLAHLPMELSLNITSHLDAQSMCRAAQVSRKWRDVINRDERAWKSLLDKDGYQLPEGELERAIKEGWGWQFGQDSHEKDLSGSSATISDSEASSPLTAPLAAAGSTRGKRKATTKYASSSKRQRRKGPAASPSSGNAQALGALHSTGPSTYASLAAAAIPQPNIGLPDLRQLHLFKSLYQRHHLIRKSWMDIQAKPKHIAFRAHQRHVVTCLQFDTDKILTGSDDTNINVYDTKTGVLRNRLVGHEGGVWALQYWGNTLVSGSTDRSVRVWDIERGRCLQVFQGHTSTVRCLVILQPAEIGKDADGKPIVMPERPLIITGSRDSTLRVWKLPSFDDPSVVQIGTPANDRENPYFIRALSGHHHSVRAIAAHGDTLVSGSYDTTVRVWKISTGEVLHRLNGHSQKVYSVVLDHERNRCISGSMDNLVKVWSLDTGACLFNLEGHSSLVGLLDLSHERLVSAAADSTLRIWDPENGQCKATLTAHTGAITCFQHDSQKVISGSDRTLKMWNVKTGECIKDLLTDLSGVWQVKFDQRRCVAAVQRNSMTYIEVLDFGACRDGFLEEQLGRRIVVDQRGREIEDVDDTPEIVPAEANHL